MEGLIGGAAQHVDDAATLIELLLAIRQRNLDGLDIHSGEAAQRLPWMTAEAVRHDVYASSLGHTLLGTMERRSILLAGSVDEARARTAADSGRGLLDGPLSDDAARALWGIVTREWLRCGGTRNAASLAAHVLQTTGLTPRRLSEEHPLYSGFLSEDVGVRVLRSHLDGLHKQEAKEEGTDTTAAWLPQEVGAVLNALESHRLEQVPHSIPWSVLMNRGPLSADEAICWWLCSARAVPINAVQASRLLGYNDHRGVEALVDSARDKLRVLRRSFGWE